MSRAKNTYRRAKKAAGYVSNGRDAVTAGKIGLAGGAAYLAHDILNRAGSKIKEYSPGRVINKVVTKTEKGVYDLDKKVEREIKKVPGGKKALDVNKGIVSWVWDKVPGISAGGPEKERTRKFYERHKLPMPYTRATKTVATTRIPPTYNADAANQKGLLGTAGMAVNALLGLYVAKEGAKYFINKAQGRKK
ncbi:hypothetical protein GF343_03170 [Candidatus Woesearchaeota archaeon]|nr:hypothetical protein [Candidatus Woesearchaeota archaeon]